MIETEYQQIHLLLLLFWLRRMSYKKIQESTVDSSDITVKEEVDDSDHWVGDVQLQMLVSEGGGHAAPNDPTIGMVTLQMTVVRVKN